MFSNLVRIGLADLRFDQKVGGVTSIASFRPDSKNNLKNYKSGTSCLRLFIMPLVELIKASY